jgi:hypothetical protein
MQLEDRHEVDGPAAPPEETSALLDGPATPNGSWSAK